MINWSNLADQPTLHLYNLKDKDGITTALSESLLKKCETNGLVTQIFLGSISSV